MSAPLLLCTDLDRTLIPNGALPESPRARRLFAQLVARPDIILAYVTGRSRALVEQAIEEYALPQPHYVIADVGTSTYRVTNQRRWLRMLGWERRIAKDWSGRSTDELAGLLRNFDGICLQEPEKQGLFKLSYYTDMRIDSDTLRDKMARVLRRAGIAARVVWSVDTQARLGLLDILPAAASKRHAIEYLREKRRISIHNAVFCGDSGNDLEVLVSPIPAVLVGNSEADFRKTVCQQAAAEGLLDQLYCAQGGFMRMNGYYSAGILEGIAHYHPEIGQSLEERSNSA